tara:strand:+ start:4768 stop:5505 length:738 start_codon:yes stop_codon:yes gene_type:complete
MANRISRDHVPFPMPDRPHALSQEWRNLTFMHWEVDPNKLKPYIPDGLDLDYFQGKAYVGTIPFMMKNVRPRFLPAVPGISTFPEFNIRTYVTKNGIPGVLFITLDAQSRITCWHAPRAYGLPYRYAKCSLDTNQDTYKWKSQRKTDGAILEGECKIIGPEMIAQRDSLEYFLFERYSLYTEINGKLHMAYTLHEPWKFHNAEVRITNNSLTESYALGINVLDPEYIHASRGVEVITWPIEEVNS